MWIECESLQTRIITLRNALLWQFCCCHKKKTGFCFSFRVLLTRILLNKKQTKQKYVEIFIKMFRKGFEELVHQTWKRYSRSKLFFCFELHLYLRCRCKGGNEIKRMNGLICILTGYLLPCGIEDHSYIVNWLVLEVIRDKLTSFLQGFFFVYYIVVEQKPFHLNCCHPVSCSSFA